MGAKECPSNTVQVDTEAECLTASIDHGVGDWAYTTRPWIGWWWNEPSGCFLVESFAFDDLGIKTVHEVRFNTDNEVRQDPWARSFEERQLVCRKPTCPRVTAESTCSARSDCSWNGQSCLACASFSSSSTCPSPCAWTGSFCQKIVLGDQGSNSCPPSSVDLTEDECKHLGTLNYATLRAGYSGSGTWGWTLFVTNLYPTGCHASSRASNYFFNRGSPGAPRSHEFKICKR